MGASILVPANHVFVHRSIELTPTPPLGSTSPGEELKILLNWIPVYGTAQQTSTQLCAESVFSPASASPTELFHLRKYTVSLIIKNYR